MLRIILFILGVLSIPCFFFSLTGLSIGILYFLFQKTPAWKRHGFVLALSAGISTFAAHTSTALEPLHLALRTGPALLVVYFVVFFTWRRWKNEDRPETSWLSGLRRHQTARMILKFTGVLLPLILWTSVSIRLDVMFDNAPRLLWVHAPSTVEQNEEFHFSVQAWDAYERLSAVYRGTVSFSTRSYHQSTLTSLDSVTAQLPVPHTFSGQKRGSDMAFAIRDGRDNGKHIFTAQIATPGIHYILVRDSFTGTTYWSNPILVKDNEKEANIYWGDIHSHSELSDGAGSPVHNFEYAKQVAGLDFYALTDHGEILMLHPGGFDRLERETNNAYDPGDFVTFHGVEWTQTRTGHFTCLFSGNRLIKKPILSYFTVPTAEKLWAALDDFTETYGCRALALPHHSTQKSYIQDWTLINPKYVKLAEISSVHGAFLFEQRHPLNVRGAIDPPREMLHGSSIIDALKMGKRLILYAASDAHDGHPGHSISHTRASVAHQRPWTTWNPRVGHPYPGGLTAVHADELTREAIFSALENGHIYATSDHGRPIVHVTINGIGTGSNKEVTLNKPDTPREIDFFLAQDGTPAASKNKSASADSHPSPNWKAVIEIIKNGKIFARIPVTDPVVRLRHTDSTPITGTEYRMENCFKKKGKYFINAYSDTSVHPEELNTGGADFYIVRVAGENGRVTYAGPIWVENND